MAARFLFWLGHEGSLKFLPTCKFFLPPGAPSSIIIYTFQRLTGPAAWH
jgi:hypothetical protein